MSVQFLDLTQMQALLQHKSLSATELAQEHLKLAQSYSHLNAYLDIQPEQTLAQARAADARLAKGDASPLLGLPIGHKDVFVTQGFATTAGSRMLQGYQSPFTATVVERLSQAGMVTVGKLNCDEFAMGSSNENSAYGPCHNPWDVHAVPGGSSGGSAVAVAAGLVPAATGTDTGGSIRQPASLCGITGIKPTYGNCSRYGLVAYASSLDQAGPMARTARDCALLLETMMGHDPKDSTSHPGPYHNLTQSLETPLAGASQDKPLAGLRVGLPDEFFTDGVSLDVAQCIESAVAKLEALGAVRVRVALPRTRLSIPTYYVLATAEASSNLSRFDGVRYGHRSQHADDLLSLYEHSRAEGFGAEVQQRILLGTYVLSHGYYDAYYLQAQRVRRLIAQDFQEAFKQCDIIAGPVSPTVAWNLGEKTDNPVHMYLADIFTLGPSLAGLPGMSMPVGFGGKHANAKSNTSPNASPRPVGLQLIGNYHAEGALLQVASIYQQHTDWHVQTPPLDAFNEASTTATGVQA